MHTHDMLYNMKKNVCHPFKDVLLGRGYLHHVNPCPSRLIDSALNIQERNVRTRARAMQKTSQHKMTAYQLRLVKNSV